MKSVRSQGLEFECPRSCVQRAWEKRSWSRVTARVSDRDPAPLCPWGYASDLARALSTDRQEASPRGLGCGIPFGVLGSSGSHRGDSGAGGIFIDSKCPGVGPQTLTPKEALSTCAPCAPGNGIWGQPGNPGSPALKVELPGAPAARNTRCVLKRLRAAAKLLEPWVGMTVVTPGGEGRGSTP